MPGFEWCAQFAASRSWRTLVSNATDRIAGRLDAEVAHVAASTAKNKKKAVVPIGEILQILSIPLLTKPM